MTWTRIGPTGSHVSSRFEGVSVAVTRILEFSCFRLNFACTLGVCAFLCFPGVFAFWTKVIQQCWRPLFVGTLGAALLAFVGPLRPR